MAKIKIDGDTLLMMMEDHSGFMTCFLDKEIGELIQIFEDDPEGENEELYERLDRHPDRYVDIEPIPSHEAFNVMENFVESLPDDQNKPILRKALSWKKPFSNFKAAIADMGDLRQQWFDYHDNAMKGYLREWLDYEGIRAELVFH